MLKNIAKVLFAVTAVFTAPTVASACPQLGLDADVVLEYSARDLSDGKSFRVLAGGDRDLDHCSSLHGAGDATGFVGENPDIEVYLSRVTGYSLDIRVVAECDSVLLVNTGNGNWFFDDDDGRGDDPRITLSRPSEGLYDIWVGTYGDDTCKARLYLATEGSAGT